MNSTILLGRGRAITPISRAQWEQHLAQAPEHSKTRLAFMAEEHQRVRYFVVSELPHVGEPLSPEYIAAGVDLPPERVNTILHELERHLFFLVRDDSGRVEWAFPLTAAETPHRLTFDSGERLYAA